MKQPIKETTLRLPNELHKQLAEEAERRGVTIKSIILEYLWEYVAEHNLQ